MSKCSMQVPGLSTSRHKKHRKIGVGGSRYIEGWNDNVHVNMNVDVNVNVNLNVHVNANVIFVGRYWSHITKNTFHEFWKIFIPYSRCSEITRRIVTMFQHASFPNCSIVCISNLLRFIRIVFQKRVGFRLGLFAMSWWIQIQIILVLGLTETSENPKIMNVRGLRVLPRANRKVTSSNWSRIILRSF